MNSERGRFAGKIALVTGAARGIGRAIALRLARDGADVAVNYRKEAERARGLADEIRSIGVRAVALEANMGDPAAISRMFEGLREFGGLDFLVCNAATGKQGTLMEATLKTWDLSMNVNARAYLLCAQAAVPLMRERGGGRILAMTARIATDRAFPNYGTIGASKAAMHALTTYMAVEFGPYNIAVNAVSPGVVDTDALHHYRDGAQILERTEAITPTGRATTVEDVAETVAFLCSDGAHQISGQIISIDGGYTRLFL